MSITLPTMIKPAVTRRPARSGWTVQRWMRDVGHYFARRDAIRSLGELSDRELQDIGLRRCQIEQAVHGMLTDPDRTRL